MIVKIFALVASALTLAVPALARAEPVLLISIDGLRPGDVLEADKRGLSIPNLRRFVKEGAHATGVTGVVPTLTYPSHTTLMTGVSPARHGIVANNSFDPMGINQGGWYWYAQDVRTPMLWEAATKAGLSTGNIHWPVSVAAKGVTWNLPQIWRTGHADDARLLDALATPGLKAQLEAVVGQPYAMGIDESLAADQNRARFASALIAAHKPDFLTVYFAALDHEEHASAPGSAAAKAGLEKIDGIVGAGERPWVRSDAYGHQSLPPLHRRRPDHAGPRRQDRVLAGDALDRRRIGRNHAGAARRRGAGGAREDAARPAGGQPGQRHRQDRRSGRAEGDGRQSAGALRGQPQARLRHRHLPGRHRAGGRPCQRQGHAWLFPRPG